MTGPGLKQHMRLAHVKEYAAHRSAAESQCSCLGLVAESPCRFCGAACKEPRTHLNRCPVLFQASFASLVHKNTSQVQDQHGPGPAGRPGGSGSGRVRGRVWLGRVRSAKRESSEEDPTEEERSSKYSKCQEKRGKGLSWSSGSGWNPKNQAWHQSSDKNKWGGE